MNVSDFQSASDWFGSEKTKCANGSSQSASEKARDHDTATTDRLILSEMVGEPHDHRCRRPYKDHAGKAIHAGTGPERFHRLTSHCKMALKHCQTSKLAKLHKTPKLSLGPFVVILRSWQGRTCRRCGSWHKQTQLLAIQSTEKQS